jgi:hypothetical protein
MFKQARSSAGDSFTLRMIISSESLVEKAMLAKDYFSFSTLEGEMPDWIRQKALKKMDYSR